jgi:FMN phosphatase YigB (HAD superfamily)
MAMTVFLDIGSGIPLVALDHRSEKHGSTRDDTGSPELGDRNCETLITEEDLGLTMEEYLCLVISFHEEAVAHGGFHKIGPAHQEPRPEMIKLLARLKSRYCLQIAVIGNDPYTLGEYKSHNSGLNHLADYYIKSSFLTKENIGVHGIVHVNYASTRTELASFGLLDL